MNFFRVTVPSEVSRIEECARLCCAEHGEQRMGGPIDWPLYRAILFDLIYNRQGAMWLYEDGGRIVGGLCGAVHQDPLTGRWRATRVFIYVMPEYRGRLSILRLMRLFEGWAREEGCQDITQSLISTMPVGTAFAYEAMGYKVLETIYVKRL